MSKKKFLNQVRKFMPKMFTYPFTCNPNLATARRRTLKDVFSKEIETTSLNLTVVTDKIQGHPTLCHLEPRKVYDKVRSEWHSGNNTS